MPPKKQKEQVLSLEDFASFAGTSSGSGSWADEEAEFTPTFQTSSGLPTGSAKSSSFGPWVSGGSTGPATGAGGQGTFTLGGGASGNRGPAAPIPDSPPFTARVSNVSYDVNEQIIQDFFTKEHGLQVETVRLPREPDGRVRGSAFVDFSSRDALVAALKLGGSQTLGRTVGVSTVDQQRGGSGGFGGAQSFDWSRRAPSGPTDGSAAGSAAQGDRFDRFRPKNTRPEEPALNWGDRRRPAEGSALHGSALHGSREPRAPREPAASLDWSKRSEARAGAPVDAPFRREREPAEQASFDWSKRAEERSPGVSGVSGDGLRRREPREPREPREQPSLDWSKRAEPRLGGADAVRRRDPAHQQPTDWTKRAEPRAGGADGARRRDAREPALDWGKRTAVPAHASKTGRDGRDNSTSSTPSTSSTASASASVASLVSSGPQKSVDPQITKLQRGFNALQIDDDDEDEEETQASSSNTQPSAPVKSIGEIQQEQRENSNEGWLQA